MFNATNARTKADAELEELTDAIAAEFEDRTQGMTTQEKKALASNLLDMLSSGQQVSAFVSGTYAQNSAGQPAAALGAGSPMPGQPQPTPPQGPSQVTPAEAFQVLQADPRFSGYAAMLQRIALQIQNPGTPGGIQVDSNGDDVRIAALERQVNDLTTEKQAAETAKQTTERQLADERDPNKRGSLAKQLADAQAAQATPADVLRKADVLVLANDAKAAVDAVRGRGGVKPHGLDDAKAAVQAVVDAAS